MINCLKCKVELEADTIYGLHRQCFAEWFGEINTTEFKDLDPKKTASSKTSYPEIKKQVNTFYHGIYLKYSARLGQTEYILKVQEPRYPELPLVEYLCNQLGGQLKIDIPPYYLINFNGRITFVTRNFMQGFTGTLHHIYKFLPLGSENHSCDELVKIILKETSKLADAAKFIEICLFDSLIGNNDRHGRNLGIIETSSGKRLAPMYDNPSCIGIEDEFFLVSDINPSGSIWTQDNRNPKPSDYIKEFQRLGYEDIVKQFSGRVVAQSAQLLSIVNNADLSEMRKNALTKLLRKRIGDFENAK